MSETREPHAAPRRNHFTPPKPLEYLESLSAAKPKGRVYGSSMLGSVMLHALVLYVLWAYPQLVFVKRDWDSTSTQPDSTGEKKYEVITYVPSNKPMYVPYRKPIGNLYSSQDALAISRPPKSQRSGNLQPYSRGTTKEPMITDIVKSLETKGTDETEKTTTAQVVPEQQNSSPKAGSPPVLEVPPSDRAPSATAMTVPPKPKETAETIGEPWAKAQESVSDNQSTRAQRDAQTRQRVAEDVAKQLKLADAGQRIFENEASALRSEGSGFFDTKGFELSDYSQYVVDKIKENWLIPRIARDDSGRSTIIFYIERDGQISGLRVVTRSGREQLDRAALNSILGASPFPPLPRDFAGEHIGAKLIFSYNEVRDRP